MFMNPHIPFHKMESATSTLDLNSFIELNPMKLAGPGKFSQSVETKLSQIIGSKSSLLTPSGTAALEMIAILLNIQPDDEVVMPSWTFSSTATAFILRGAKIVFVDVELDTLNMQPDLVENAITSKTKALVTINYGGLPGQIESLERIAQKNGLFFVEDNAHGFGGSINGKNLGNFGTLSALSFHQTKNLQCGEGGALIINSAEFRERSEIIREKGTNRSSYIRGEIDKYTWRDIGSSFVISELLASYLDLNLHSFELTQNARRTTWALYESHLAGWANDNGVKIPKSQQGVVPACHAFWIVLSTAEDSYRFIKHMETSSIGASRHYVPLHSAPAATNYHCRTYKSMENTDKLGEQLVRLPMYSSLSENEISRIIDTVKSFK